MTDRRFTYDPKLLEECARSSLLAEASSFDTTTSRPSENHPFSNSDEVQRLHHESCQILFYQHAQHYERQPHDDEHENARRMENFVQNVVFVHQHNTASAAATAPGHAVRHHVGLNRFADMDWQTVLPVADAPLADAQGFLRNRELGSQPDEGGNGSTNRENNVGDALLAFYDLEDLKHLKKTLQSDLSSGIITLLSSSEEILNAAAKLAIGKGSYNKLNPKVHKDRHYYQDLSDTFLDVPMDQQTVFQTPDLSFPEDDGALLSIKRNRKYDDPAAKEDDVSLADANPDDDFATHLNWATGANPDGVPIVNDAFDQGSCGSCWAFAAAGSVEASAARREAYYSYTDYMTDHPSMLNYTATFYNDTELKEDAIAFAQSQERDAFKLLNLSVQELLDCDTTADQGCTGGNPLLAFYFIHRYGLTSWESYPYQEAQAHCKKALMRQPVASVKSWGIISPNHENHMELALRFVGPIAVGVNGADPSFLSYTGGIFDKVECKQGANHALLIVGYGQEQMGDGRIVRYWIARNSWGKGWGEDGFVRIARRRGSKGLPGVCGIARSPSVALGGFLLQQEGLHSSSAGAFSVTVSPLPYTTAERFCDLFGLSLDGYCGKFADWVPAHHAVLVGCIGITLALASIWPLSSDWRRRRRRKRLRQERRRKSAGEQKETEGDVGNGVGLLSPEVPADHAETTESSPLLALDAGNGETSYGADEAR